MNKDIHSCVVKLNYVSSVLAGINGDIREGMPGRAIKIAEKDLPGVIKILDVVKNTLTNLREDSHE